MSIQQFFSAYDATQQSSELDFIYCPKCRTRLEKKKTEDIPRNFCPNCKYIQYINPLPGVAVIIEKNRNILIGKRSPHSVEPNKWCLPCGFIEHHENYLEAAHRETFEETGLEINITSLVNVFSNHINPDIHSIVPVLTAEIIGGTIGPGDDLVELDWLSKSDPFPEMAFEGERYIIGEYFEGALVRIPVDPRFRIASQ